MRTQKELEHLYETLDAIWNSLDKNRPQDKNNPNKKKGYTFFQKDKGGVL